MSSIFNTFLVTPLYNTLIALLAAIPGADAGVAIILLTVIVRFVLYPLSKKAVHTQVQMQEIAPALQEIREKYKDNAQLQAQKTLELYRQAGVNPFSGFLVLLIQLPIIFALYRIFLHAGFPNVDMSMLYSFIQAPESIHTVFLGLIDLTQKSAILALFAAASTYFQIKLAVSKQALPSDGKNSFQNDLARAMQTQMKYIFPVIVFFISYSISGVIALYWLTSNLFTIGQEIVVRRKLTKQKTA